MPLAALTPKFDNAIAVVRSMSEENARKKDLTLGLQILSVIESLFESFIYQLKDMQPEEALKYNKEFILLLNEFNAILVKLDKHSDKKFYDALAQLIDTAESIEATLDVLSIPELANGQRKYHEEKVKGTHLKGSIVWKPGMYSK